MGAVLKKNVDLRATHLKLSSPDGEYVATYNGSEIGMDAPTVGHVDVRDKKGRPIYSASSTPEIQFSGDSKTLIHRSRIGGDLVHVELPSGREIKN